MSLNNNYENQTIQEHHHFSPESQHRRNMGKLHTRAGELDDERLKKTTERSAQGKHRNDLRKAAELPSYLIEANIKKGKDRQRVYQDEEERGRRGFPLWRITHNGPGQGDGLGKVSGSGQGSCRGSGRWSA